MNPPTMLTLEELENNSTPSSTNEQNSFELVPIPTNENKELMIIPNAVHTDLYDRKDIIPFDKIEEFFKTYLK